MEHERTDGLGNVTEDLNGSTLNRAEIYLGNTHLGTYTGGNTYFSHTDLLGSERARTLMTTPNTASQTCTNLPFGDNQSCTGTETSPLHSTGLQRDTESGLDQTWYRKYSGVQGRWLSLDPLAGSPENPQSLDRYPYVLNRPTSLMDPLGMAALCIYEGTVWDYPDGHTEIGGLSITCYNYGPGPDTCKGKACHDSDKDKRTQPSYWLTFKATHQCAQDAANMLSLAQLTNTQDTLLGNLLLGNDFSSVFGMIVGPPHPDAPGTAPAASSRFWDGLQTAASNGLTAGVNWLLAAAPSILGKERYKVAFSGAGDAFVKGTFRVAKPAAKAALGTIADLFTGKAIYDGLVYTGALFYCGEQAF